MPSFVHLGYPKTGTTTLQNRFLNGNPEIVYLGIPFATDRIREIVELDVMMKDEVEFDAKASREALADELQRLGAREDSKVVLSYENMGFSRDNHRDRLIVARRMTEILPGAQFIVTIRNQFEFISSMYKQSVYAGMFIDYEDFLNISWSRFYRSTFPQLKYYEFIKALQGLAGPEGVHVLCYEQLRHDSKQFMRSFCDYVGITFAELPDEKDNVGLSRSGLKLKRLLNRVVPYELGRTYFLPRTRELGASQDAGNFRYRYMLFSNNLVQGMDRKLGLTNHRLELMPEWRERLQELYAESNRKLAYEYGLALEDYRYPV